MENKNNFFKLDVDVKNTLPGSRFPYCLINPFLVEVAITILSP